MRPSRSLFLKFISTFRKFSKRESSPPTLKSDKRFERSVAVKLLERLERAGLPVNGAKRLNGWNASNGSIPMRLREDAKGRHGFGGPPRTRKTLGQKSVVIVIAVTPSVVVIPMQISPVSVNVLLQIVYLVIVLAGFVLIAL